MTRIDPSLLMAAALREQAAARLRDSAKTRAASHTRQPGGAARPKAQRPDGRSARMQSALMRNVQALAADDPDRRRKAFRMYLGAVLSAAFGEDLLGERDFDQVVNAVQARMQADRHLRLACDAAAEALLDGIVPPLGADSPPSADAAAAP